MCFKGMGNIWDSWYDRKTKGTENIRMPKNLKSLVILRWSLQISSPPLHKNVKYRKFLSLLLPCFPSPCKMMGKVFSPYFGRVKAKDILSKQKVRNPVPLLARCEENLIISKSIMLKLDSNFTLKSHPAFRLEPHVKIEYSKSYKIWTMKINPPGLCIAQPLWL